LENLISIYPHRTAKSLIFRGDGRNNIIEGNCFSKFLAPLTRNGVVSAGFVPIQNAKPPITKVLMNPPFALKSSSEKEYKFVNHALNQMSDSGILFSILPSSVMVKGGKSLTWRREILLKNNTLLAVITFPSDLFYPVSQQTIGVFVKKGIPHPKEQKVFWARTINDGMLKKKGKRLPSPRATNDLERVKHNLRAFLVDPNISIEDIPEFQKASPIDMSDKHMELVPEAYISTRAPSTDEIESGMESLIRESVAYLIKAKQEGIFFDQN
jgi:type I restriction-modification system DNA methylase subunit